MEHHKIIEEWYSLYADDVYNFLIYYTNKNEAEDILQDVFIKAYKNLEYFKGNANPKTWLIKIARNCAIDLSRRRNLLKTIFSKSFFQNHDNTPEELLIINEDVAELYRQINKLPEKYREIIILRGIIELSVNETAFITGWTEQNVNLTFHRAKKKLKDSYLKGSELGESI
jgi:RNA polymerase sigma-70 factor, ECF subfamily